MISSKFDEVKRNSVWREHLKKEAKEEFRSHDFSVNLGQIATISDKPTQFNPHDLVRMAAEFNEQGTTVQDLAGDMKLTGAAPAEAAEDGELPTCSSRTYGWRWKEGMEAAERDKRWKVPKGKCAETEYADNYASLFGISVYSKSAAR